MKVRFRLLAMIALAAGLAACKSQGDIVINQGVGITALRTVCPAVGIPDYTGDITLFQHKFRVTLGSILPIIAAS